MRNQVVQIQFFSSREIISNRSTFITVSPQPQPRPNLNTMAPQKTPASIKSADADAKKKAAAKSGTRKTPIKKSTVATPKTTLKSKKMPALKAMKAETTKPKANPAVAVKKTSPLRKNKMIKKSSLKTSKIPSKKISLKTLKSPAVKSKAVKKASPLKKVAGKVIKKKGEKMAIKKVDAKSSKGGVAAFDLEAFVKVKFSELEKTAHQKKVMLETQDFHVSISHCCRTCLDEPTALWRT